MSDENEILNLDQNINKETDNHQKNNDNINISDNNSGLSRFKTKEYSEIIRNPDCAFVTEDSEKRFYYFCLCSEVAYFPICESCALSCHKDHNPQIKIEGYFTCNCGLKNHRISERSQSRFIERSAVPKKCFYTEFIDKSYTKGFFKSPSGKNLCSICFFADQCNSEVSEKDKKEKSNDFSNPNFSGKCECDKHYEINVVTLSNELDKKIILNNFLLNFNFNIISICPSLRKIFIDFLNEKIQELLDYEEKKKQTELFRRKSSSALRALSAKGSLNPEAMSSYIFKVNENKDPYIVFNTDFVIFTLFSIFKTFKKDYSSQYLHVKNIFTEAIKPQDLIEVLKKTVNFQRLLDYNENVELYFKTKANFAFMIYHVHIKSHFLNFNNLLNLKSTLNLNIVQRILYIHQSKKFYRFGLLSQSLSKNKASNNPADPGDIPLYDFDQKLENWENFIYEFADELINIVDTMLQVHDNLPIIKNVMSDVVVTISKIMKFLIKYNLIDDDLKEKYFEFMQDTLVAFVNELDDCEQEYLEIVAEVGEASEQPDFEDLSHAAKIKLLDAKGFQSESQKLNDKFNENENLKNSVWFVLPVLKGIFYHMLKKNDDLVIKKLKGQYSKTQSQEKYCFISTSDADMLSKIFLLCMKIFNENSYRNKNEESVYKKKILKFF